MTIRTNYSGGGVGESSAFYIWKAIGDMGHVALQADSTETPDLILNIDGQVHVPKIPGIPYFYWETDSFFHGPHPEPQIFDKLFIGGCPEDLAKYPTGTVFLPHAFDPDIHKPYPVEKDYDIVMVGSKGELYSERMRLVELLKTKFSVLDVETKFGKDYSLAMSRGKLIFNRSLGEKNIPMRFFEGMAIGCLLENYNQNLDNLAKANTHYIPYSNDENLIEQASFYLKNSDLRDKMSKSSRENALARHTYIHRVKEILSYV